MAKDYAKGGYSSQASKKRKAPTPTRQSKSNKPALLRRSSLLWGGFLFAGILVGLFISGLVYLSHHKANSTAAISAKANDSQAEIVKTATRKNVINKVVEKPHYDFYTILPSKDLDNSKVSEEITVAKPPQEEFILQVASVKEFQDADRLRAQLLLLGFEVFINKSQSGDITWHRVNVGPYKSLHEAEEKQDELRQSQINTMLLKRNKTA